MILFCSSLLYFHKHVTAKEFAKFMPDVLDALWRIMEISNEALDNMVFKALVNVLLLITDEHNKFTQFVPVLELYINENFYHTLAYNKLLIVLKESVEDASIQTKDLTEVMKCLRYIFKFVVRSRQLFSECNNAKGQEPFEQLLKEVMTSLVQLMFYTSEGLHSAQSHCLKQMILAVPDLVKVFDQLKLSEVLVKMINGLPDKQLDLSKIATIQGLVHCPLFEDVECREILLPAMASHIKDLSVTYRSHPEIMPKVSETLGDLLDKLSTLPHKDPDIREMMHKCLRTIISNVACHASSANPALSRATLANMIGLLNEMTPSHYTHFIDHFQITSDPEGRANLLHFVKDEVLRLFQDRFDKIFPGDWTTMILLKNNVMMRALCQISHIIRDFFSYESDFELKAWEAFFKCAISFIMQPALQLEKFSENKRLKILGMYGDMRKTMGKEVKQMWFNLGQNKIHFVPEMVGDFLEMALIPEPELRRATIPIFFDMIQCEFYSSRFQAQDGKRDSTMSKANFQEFQRELISKLDHFIGEKGFGDDHFLQKYKSIMLSHCEEHTSLKESGIWYVEMTSRLIELLLEYRTTCHSNDSRENQMSCIANLLDFYSSSEINREDLYVKYLKELSALHEKCQNQTEAGFTVLQYARILEWSEKPLDDHWSKSRKCNTHRKLKQHLYKDIIDLFDKGKMWEKALEICKELCIQYELQTFDYREMAQMCQRMSKLYEKIMSCTNEPERDPVYYRVAFVGRGFPAFLQNKVFVYRGRGFEHMVNFTHRLLDQFPNAETMKKLDPPTEEEKEDIKQRLQINHVTPLMDGNPAFEDKIISPQIMNYYKLNDVSKFTYSRPFHKGQKDRDNEFATLWVERTQIEIRESFPGILQWFPVVDPPVVYELTPLDNAIETMEATNESVRSLIQEFSCNQNANITNLTMKLNGIISKFLLFATCQNDMD